MIKETKLNDYDIKISLDDISYIVFRNIDNLIEIIDVFTKEEYRCKGYIQLLFKYLINKYNYDCLLEVNSNNSVAKHVYEKFGFEVINVRKKYYKDGDALVMKRRNTYIFAIESSCDETSASIVMNGKKDISTVINTQIDVHKNYGGVVPEIASRMHMENITIVIDECLKKANMTLDMMDAIAVTYAPGLLGSLIVGVECAKTLSYMYKKPLIAVNHMMGHISANNIEHDLKYPLISLIISGGHTDLIYMKSESEFEYIGRTKDDAIGECYDKVARVLDIPYPGGPNIEKLARSGKMTYNMPKILNDNSYDFSFSGVKSHVVNLVHNEKQRGNEINKEDLAFSFQTCVSEHLIQRSKRALMEYKVKTFTVSGGVSANDYIKEKLKNMCDEIDVEFVYPSKKYCTDNATMIGAAAYILYKEKRFATLQLNPKSNEEL